jgi:hypothetical protein
MANHFIDGASAVLALYRQFSDQAYQTGAHWGVHRQFVEDPLLAEPPRPFEKEDPGPPKSFKQDLLD